MPLLNHTVKVKSLSLALILCLLGGTNTHAAALADPRTEALSHRLFPLLSQPAAWRGDETDRRRRLAVCGQTPACLMWTAPEGESLAGDDGTRAEILREINGINQILAVYGQGRTPRYPEIDGPKDAAGTPGFAATVSHAIAESQAAGEGGDPSLGLALALLAGNDRFEAIAFEPLDATCNAAAIARARTIDWSRYPFTALIVPGNGPQDLQTPLSPVGAERVKLAAQRFAAGLAPFIIVSGGNVHPRGTTHIEALEMARALTAQYGIPADAIVIEPYARHTTTNLRNAARRLFALNAPPDRDALIVSDDKQIAKISNPKLAARDQAELGYQPGDLRPRPSPNELAFRPSPTSLRVDPADPLDP